jgi:exonuclease III
MNEVKLNKDGEVIVIKLTIKGKKTTIISMYVESKGDPQKKKKFFDKMKGILNSKDLEDNLIIGGDANSGWSKKDTSTQEGKVDKSIRTFCEEMEYNEIETKRN